MQVPQTEQHRVDGTEWQESDRLRVASEVERLGAKSVLEFGPGASTQTFLDLGVERIVTCEHLDQWLDVAKERFKDAPRVTVLKFYDEFPVVVDGLDTEEQFDIGFVDSPKGFDPVRKVHEGYEDYSRLNTLIFALERCKVVLLHDALRAHEQASLRRLQDDGTIDGVALLTSEIGMARIIRR
jgi:predicted O-methyltransferase YrrM